MKIKKNKVMEELSELIKLRNETLRTYGDSHINEETAISYCRTITYLNKKIDMITEHNSLEGLVYDFCNHLNKYEGLENVRFDFMFNDYMNEKYETK